MKRLIAKYPGTCISCNQPIRRGEPICFFGRGQAEHESCTQVRAEEAEETGDNFDEDESAWPPPAGVLANDRRLARRGLSVIRFSSGHVMTQNSRGRCEDAPCCGCCS